MMTVLGNHDITLLAVAEEALPFQEERHTFSDILKNGQRDEYLDWLKHCPLAHYDPDRTTLLVHAGLVPQWGVSLALTLAKEVETVLQGGESATLLGHLYGNTPDSWSPDLTGWSRFRFIVNALTRIRFCTREGVLDFLSKEDRHTTPVDYFPWFEVSPLQKEGIKIIFGHWAALEGKTGMPYAIALDTGCVWGKQLTAYALETGTVYCLDCPRR
jgi:bis(5'-nucleosyl)-tetraphosphatase (symmetrical)